MSGIVQHLDQHLGEAAAHYAVYPGPSGFVHRVRPTQERPWSTLYTDGMSSRALPQPDGESALEDPHIELVVACPEGWFTDDDGSAFDPAADNIGDWLVELLQWMMQLPWRIDYPLYAGAILPNGDPAEPYADDVRFCGLLVAPVASLPVDAQDVQDGDRRVRLLSLVLLDQGELAFASEHGVEALYERLDAHGVFERVDPDRPSVLTDIAAS